MKMPLLLTFVVGTAALPSIAHAQADLCAIPDSLPRATPAFAPPSAINKRAATGHLLALSWSPQFCRANGSNPIHKAQCGGTPQQFGFILHGLWPDGPARDDPAWCAPAEALPSSLVRKNFCMMPSVSLQQHEWAKHGTCMTKDPEPYFKASAFLFGALRWPDMDKLSRNRPNVSQFIQAFVAQNPGLQPNMIRVETSRGNWLEGVRICLDTAYKRRACPRDERGASARAALKIWRLSK